jgi:hypothetical protein
MPREIKRTTDDTSSSSGNSGGKAKDAHHLWLQPLEKLDSRNFHYDLFPEEARRLQLIADAQPGTTGTIAQQPDIPTSRASVPSYPRDIGNAYTTAEQKQASDTSIAIDHTKINGERLLEIAKSFNDLSRSTKKQNSEAKHFYQRIVRCLNQVLTKKSIPPLTLHAELADTEYEPPSDPNEALSQAVEKMRAPRWGTHNKTVGKLRGFADEIENWMKE